MIIIIFNIVLLFFPDFDAKKSISLEELENINMEEQVIIKTYGYSCERYEYSEKKLIRKYPDIFIQNINIIPTQDIKTGNTFLCKVRHLEKDIYEILDWKYIQPIERKDLYIFPKKYKSYFERFLEKFQEH
jgi:hypothetical protein